MPFALSADIFGSWFGQKFATAILVCACLLVSVSLHCQLNVVHIDVWVFSLHCLDCFPQLHIKTLKEIQEKATQLTQQCVLCFGILGPFLCWVYCWIKTSYLLFQIFVGALDQSVTEDLFFFFPITEDLLKSVFGQFGDLVHVKIPARKRCGFVQYASR